VDKAQSPKKKPKPSVEGGGGGSSEWCHDGINLATEHAKFRSSEDEITLTAEPRGWEQFFNRAAARQFNDGVHFYARVVQLLRSNEKLNALDQLGHGEVAAADDNHERRTCVRMVVFYVCQFGNAHGGRTVPLAVRVGKHC
jgi:hypothetical protein